MITGQEAISAGCTITSNSCPAWIRTGFGYYWTMSAYSSVSYDALIVYVTLGCLGSNIISSSYDARAVVVISK